MGRTKEFFNLQPVQTTLTALYEHLTRPTKTDPLPTVGALGRVLAAAPRSHADLPSFVRSTMDGYAVRAADTFGATQTLPAYLRLTDSVEMGDVPTTDVQPGEAARIHTGAMLPPGADAVVMVERTQPMGDDEIEVLAAVAPGENLVQIGEDVAAGATILPVGHRIRPQDIGGLLAVGVLEVDVAAPITIGILGSGDELVPPQQTPKPGQIRDINTYTLSALLQQAGATVTSYGIAADTLDDLKRRATQAIAQNDMLVMTAGSSVSTRDLTREVIASLGKPGILQHGLAVKPGKPAIIAACDGKPVIGLPGNPVSAMLVARQVVLPVLAHLSGEHVRAQGAIRAKLTANIASTTGREDTVPVRLRETDGETVAEPVFGKSNLIFTLIEADGLAFVPLNSNGLQAGTIVDVMPF